MLKHIPFYATLLGRELSSGKKANNGMVLVYGAIEAHSMGSKGCIASNRLIAEETGLSSGTVANYISELNRAGWIEAVIKTINGGIYRDKINTLLTISTPSFPDEPLHTQMIPPSSANDTPLHTQMIPPSHPDEHRIQLEDSKEYSEKTNNNNKLLLLLNSKTNRNFRTLPNGYKTTLKKFTLEEIEIALTNLANDGWHKEKLGELKSDYLLRASTIDNFLNRKSKKQLEISNEKLKEIGVI
jgi:DNA-binding transcriptional MocR family regulator